MIRRALIAAIASLSLGCSGGLWGEQSSTDTGRFELENSKIDLSFSVFDSFREFWLSTN